MIDRNARNKLADLIRGLASGLITNDEFGDSLPKSEDRAISEVYIKGAWFLYDDLREYKLKGPHSLSSEDNSKVARWVLFLKTDFEYEWPSISFKKRFLHLASLGLLGKSVKAQWEEVGNIDIWPFLNNEQFTVAKQRYGYLGINNT